MTAAVLNGALPDVDPLTLRAIVELQLEDSEQFAAKSKGKQREDGKTDAQVALDMYVEDLKNCDAFLQDRNMAQSLAMAILQDGELIASAYKQEQQLAEDRELAHRLANGERIPPPGPVTKQQSGAKKGQKEQNDPWKDQELLEKVAAIYMQAPEETELHEVSEDENSDGTVAESSAWAASRKQIRKRALRNCVSCREQKDFFEVARVPCNHEYCRPCLDGLFTLAMKDETIFPPRCCGQEFPLDQVRFFLPPLLAKEFESKYEELSTRNRTYCHELSCNAFIPADSHDGDVATCAKCSRTTCASCKGPSHSGDCQNDEALQQLIETANVAGYQRCYQCFRFIELRTGCNHISCPCGAQFCYVCGERWKTCRCEQWDEGRLLDRATQLVDRNLDPRRRLFQPVRVAHRQPVFRTPNPSSSAAGPAEENRENEDTASVGTSIPDAVDTEPGTPDTLDGVVPALRPAQARRRDLIAQAMEQLRHNHECGHGSWRFVRGRHRCEECRDTLREYIFECRQCQLRACNRCRRNRL